jgi:VanZ family protein
MIGALEVLQLWAPGRHARIEDFAVDALAACVGFAFVAGLALITKWTRASAQ